MINITNERIQNIPCHIGRIHSIAYDGCEFLLLTRNQKGILKLDQALCPIRTIPTCRKYQHLCFCQQSHMYWAMSDQQPCNLFLLDENFCEVDVIKLPSNGLKRPHALSCSSCSDELMILYANTIVRINVYKKGYVIYPLENNDIHTIDVLLIKNGFILAYMKDHHSFIEVNCQAFGKPCHFCIPDGFYLEGMYETNVTQPDSNCRIYNINLLLCNASNQQQAILPLRIHGCEEIHPCACEDSFECNHACTCEESCHCEETSTSCYQGVNEILHSIALEEAGLAHILNAEGEKIQKAIAGDITIDELLQVNDSVSTTISKITVLEVQLIAKLESVLCFCEDVDEDDCPSNPPCEPCNEMHQN